MNIRKYMQIISWHYFDTSRLAAGLFIAYCRNVSFFHFVAVRLLWFQCFPHSRWPSQTPAPWPTVTVKTFRFVGNTLLSAEQLAPAVASYLNRPVELVELRKATAAVAEAYRQVGWIVRVYLPQQEIQDGIVTIQIVEAVFGGVKLEGQHATRLSLAQIKKGFEAQQPEGTPLNANALDRALLLADDLPGVAVSGSLHEGANARETDLILKVADEPLIVGEVNLDNTGSRSTGNDRLAANLNLNSPFGLGDLLSSNVIHTQGSDYLRMAFTLPVGADGWRVGANASALNYRLITPEFAVLNGKGTSSTAGLEANYPIIRSRLKNLYLGMNYDNKQFDNQSNNLTQSHYQINTLTAALNGNSFDNLGGGGANSGSLVLVWGRVALGTLDSGENAALNGAYSKLHYSLTRQQVLTQYCLVNKNAWCWGAWLIYGVSSFSCPIVTGSFFDPSNISFTSTRNGTMGSYFT